MRETVFLARHRGVAIRHEVADFGTHEGVLGRWVREVKVDPKQVFPGRGKMKAEDAEVARLKLELSKTRKEPR